MEEKWVTVYIIQPKHRPYLRLEWVDPDTGARTGVTTKTTVRAKAEKMRRIQERDLNSGRAEERKRLALRRMAWKAFSDRYAAEKLADRRQATRDRWGYVSAAFLRLARPKNLAAVDASLLSRYAATLRERGRSKASVSQHLAYLRAALRWAARVGFIQAAPAVEMPKLPRKFCVRKTDHAGYLKLLEAAPNADWRLFIQTAWHTGMRRGELLVLEWSGENGKPWIDLVRGRVWLPAEWCKSDADSWLPLHPDLVSALAAARKDQGKVFALSSPNEASRVFKVIALKAGVPITLHDLRRSFGSRYAPLVSAPVLKRLMRHADLRTTLAHYTDLDDVLEEAILKS